MNQGAIVKGVGFVAAMFMAAISFLAKADAAVELCGAHLKPLVAAAAANAEAPQVYGYALYAFSERSVEGDVVADTNRLVRVDVPDHAASIARR